MIKIAPLIVKIDHINKAEILNWLKSVNVTTNLKIITIQLWNRRTWANSVKSLNCFISAICSTKLDKSCFNSHSFPSDALSHSNWKSLEISWTPAPTSKNEPSAKHRDGKILYATAYVDTLSIINAHANPSGVL